MRKWFNPFDRFVKKTKGNQFYVVWNRGLGDIPLGLYALVMRLRQLRPQSKITFWTRPDLIEAMRMLPDVDVEVKPWKRGERPEVSGDGVIAWPDPTKWFKWQLGSLVPKLVWSEAFDGCSKTFSVPQDSVGMHISTETGMYYGYEKNWDLKAWRDLFKKISGERKGKVLLFGMKAEPAFIMDDVIDLRGKTSCFEMLSIIKNHCKYLIAPDSGVLSIAYYIDSNFPLRIVSLWADPKQGILRQNVNSPNPALEHIPLVGANDNVANITVDKAYQELFR